MYIVGPLLIKVDHSYAQSHISLGKVLGEYKELEQLIGIPNSFPDALLRLKIIYQSFLEGGQN